MNTVRSRGATAFTAAIALSLAAIPAVMVAGDATTGAGGPTALTPASDPYAEALTLATTSESGVVSFAGKTQEFSGGQYCELTDNPGDQASLLQITGVVGPEIDSTDLAGFRGGQIGVFEQSNASQCFRVDAGSFTDVETLGLALGGDVRDTFGPMLAEAATFDLEMRTKDVAIAATTYLGDEQTGAFNFTTPRNNKVGTHRTFEIADEGLLFDRVELSAAVGSFSLEGGLHSGTPTSFDLVSLADAYFCDPGTVESGEVPGAVNTLTEDNTTVRYIGNVTGGQSCFGVRLTSGADDVQFLKPLDVARDAQFIFKTDWELDPREGGWTPEVSLPAIFIDFELRKAVAEHVLPFCPPELFDAKGNLVGTTDAEVLAALPDFEDEGIPGDEGTQFACIGSRHVGALAENTVTDQIYLVGDARMRW